MSCQVCLSTLRAGDLFCSACGAVVPNQSTSAPVSEARGRIAGERKFLTVLCSDLQRSTDLISELDPEEAISRLEPALIAMRTAVRRNRGIVSKEGGDGLIALFGAPRADDNHAVLACNAGIELVRRIKLLEDPKLHVRVGIHSGYVVAHVIEADFSSIYEAGGPAVHLVKRFESAANAGQILASESCQSLANGVVTFKALPPKRMEGFRAPVPCYEVVEISGLSRWRARSANVHSSFVGRHEQISQLERAAQAVGPSGKIAAVVGTAGIGKSRVVHEFVTTLRERDWQVIEAECNPLEQAAPYSLLKRLVQGVLQAEGTTLANYVGTSEDPAPSHAELWPAALNSVLDEPVGNTRWRNLEPLLRRRVIVDAVRSMLDQVVSSRPTVLLLEDLHWIDGQSETVIEALMSLAASRPLLVLLTWRTEYTPAWLEGLDVLRIWLRSLDAASANVLLDNLLGTAAELDPLKARILRHTGQIPLFIEEVARQLLNRRAAGEDRISWDSLEIPPTVQGVIASRIDRLPKEDKALLQLASVLGPRVSPHLLAAMTELPVAQLQSRLWSLEILDFLEEARSGLSVEYVFAHDLIREVAYESILRSQREVLHGRTLTALEATSAGREEDVAEALCHHAIKAQDWIKTDRYGHLAARKAFARSAFRDATGYFQCAMDAVDKQSASILREQRAIDLRIEARLAFAALGDIERWFELCRDAEARSEKIQDEERRLASIAMRAAALNFYATPYEAIAVAEEAVALANQIDNTPWLCLVEYGLGQSCFLAGRYRDAALHLAKATALLTAAPKNVPPGTTGSSLLVLCHMMSAIVHAWLGEFDHAERRAEEASILAEATDRPYDMIAADYSLGVVQMMRGDLEEAEVSLDQALRVSLESEASLFRPLIMSALGSVYSQQGHARRAVAILLQAKDEADKLGHETSKAAVSAYLGAAYGQLGDIQHGLTLLRACQASARQKGYAGIEALAASAEAHILTSQGGHRIEEAMGCLQRIIEFTARLEALPLLGAARGLRARLLAASGRTDEARVELVQAITLFDQSKMTVHLERARAELSNFPDI
ncbi:ATP-binding protein [Bradyrhizobium sp. BWA-3-5]|uniref:ATP-binding protein n=1 Tax=Bradyrhizobium sp. BWA-3-5 TaxID=3080013 RepID=UPI00293F00D0|nr:AAA family ATPase [Bradyrhizobium sp. BWA-3-5]WOH68132.1 AAA family ATPase [Bradyrhizobium sp. BWA-3-5]